MSNIKSKNAKSSQNTETRRGGVQVSGAGKEGSSVGNQHHPEDHRLQLPSVEDLLSSRCLSRAPTILEDPS